jgi:putative ABC transport system permease protein
MVREFIILLVISLIIAIPVGWVIITRLLEQFASKIEINVFVFALIAAGSIVIALLTVSFQAVKASWINPAEALKIE